jgi:hypothetical protein
MVYFIQRDLAKKLAMIEQHILQSKMRITRQRRRIENEESSGDVATLSRSLGSFGKIPKSFNDLRGVRC